MTRDASQITVTCIPISDPSGFGGPTRPSPFRTRSWADTLAILRAELAALDADHVILEIDLDADDLRLDGWPKAKARVRSGRVRLAFDTREHGRLTYATDRFAGQWTDDLPDWQLNVRAIALGLEALRKVDRYGITKAGQQYTGFKAIGAGAGATPLGAEPRMTEHDALVVIGGVLGLHVEDAESMQGQRSYWKRARALAHPDRHGGDQTLWDQVEEAGRVLGVDR